MDPTDWFDTPKGLLLGVLRALWWLAWDFCFQTIGWSVGWCALRVLTLGRFPEERLGDVDETPPRKALFVELVGLVILATGIWALAGSLP
jgi:hypothetical protein